MPDLLARLDEQLSACASALPPASWEQPSLCAGWTNRDVLAHLVLGYQLPATRLLAEMARHRGSFDKANSQLARSYAHDRQPAALIGEFDQLRGQPRGIGRILPRPLMLGDHVVHFLDIALPLGCQPEIPAETARAVLDTEVKVPNPFVPARRRATGLSIRATDLDWHRPKSSGPQLFGPATALISVLAGRSHAIGQLGGNGLDIIRARTA
jgi:uncharacterized protein (TIGR03083 family)